MDQKNQHLFYPLYKEFEQKHFKDLTVAVEQHYSFVGSEEDKEFFLKCLLCLQVSKDYRSPLAALSQNLTKETNVAVINEEVRNKGFEIDYSWALWLSEKEIGAMAEKLFSNKLEIIGTQDEYNEFVLRYLISIWLVAWEGPLYAVLKQIEKSGKADLKELNKIMSVWDFTEIFKTSS